MASHLRFIIFLCLVSFREVGTSRSSRRWSNDHYITPVHSQVIASTTSAHSQIKFRRQLRDLAVLEILVSGMQHIQTHIDVDIFALVIKRDKVSNPTYRSPGLIDVGHVYGSTGAITQSRGWMEERVPRYKISVATVEGCSHKRIYDLMALGMNILWDSGWVSDLSFSTSFPSRGVCRGSSVR